MVYTPICALDTSSISRHICAREFQKLIESLLYMIYRPYLIHVHQAMVVHVDHLGIQRAGSHLIMLMTSKEIPPNASDNLARIDRILVAVTVHKETHICKFAVRVFTDLVGVSQFRQHMIQNSAVSLVLEILQGTVDVDLLTLCLLFLSRLQPGDHTAHTTGKKLRSHSKGILHGIKKVAVLVANSLK